MALDSSAALLAFSFATLPGYTGPLVCYFKQATKSRTANNVLGQGLSNIAFNRSSYLIFGGRVLAKVALGRVLAFWQQTPRLPKKAKKGLP